MSEDGDPLDPRERHLAEGEAALVLIESLILTLMEKRVLSPDEIMQAVEEVILVKRQMAADGTAPRLSSLSASMLSQIANSFAAAQPLADGEDRTA